MTSEKKRESNRANARKSTGPKSERGKQRAKFSALKLGIYAQAPILPGESRQLFEEIQFQVLDYFQPFGPVEIVLCREIGNVMWRLRRLEQAEAVAINRASYAILASEIPRREGVTDEDIEKIIDHQLVNSLWHAEGRTMEVSCLPEQTEKTVVRTTPAGAILVPFSSPPEGLTFLRAYTSANSKSPGVEIESMIRTLTRHLVGLQTELGAMQERRGAVTPSDRDDSDEG